MKLFKKPKSKFFWYDFTVRGRRYRASTQETKSVRALKAASLKLASVMENTDPLPSKPTALGEFAERFLAWVVTARLEEMTRKFYRNGWRLLKATPIVKVRVNQITSDCAEQLKFPGSAANANCALRTLRRMPSMRFVTWFTILATSGSVIRVADVQGGTNVAVSELGLHLGRVCFFLAMRCT